MCGIAAEHGQPSFEEGRRMLGRLVHRGPDGEGEVELDHAWLGHRRLSIVDLDGGDQPLLTPAGDHWLVGNGEVYNHEEVSARLGGPAGRTHSDNEVALKLLDRRGPQSLGALEGMYALVAAGADGSFVAARDPVGIKPLYWAPGEDRVRFASEMAAFDVDVQPRVEPFPPGFTWTPQRGLQRFANAVPDGHGSDANPELDDVLGGVRESLVCAVERQLMGDVPVGVFLSGGLDSCLVAAIAARSLARDGERLQTFAVGIEGSPDLLAARQAARHLGAEHRERIYTAQEAIDAVPRVVRAIEHFDPSLVRSAVPNLLLAEMTSEHVKVVLTGEGADELFAGYEYHAELTDPEDLHEDLVRTVGGLHELNLQRCDRVTMAHGLEARVPFLDRAFIAYALGIDPRQKLRGPGRPEKQLLRAAFRGWLPDELLWRTKAQFGDGSGAASVLTRAMEESVSAAELEAERDATDPPLRTREELAYFRIFRAHLPGIRPERALGRFATA